MELGNILYQNAVEVKVAENTDETTNILGTIFNPKKTSQIFNPNKCPPTIEEAQKHSVTHFNLRGRTALALNIRKKNN